MWLPGEMKEFGKEPRHRYLSGASFSPIGCKRVAGKQSHLRGKKSKVKKDGGQVLERGVKYKLNKEVIDQMRKVVLDALQVC